jgi:hypothetical protein
MQQISLSFATIGSTVTPKAVSPTAGHCMQQISLSFAAIGSTVTPKAVSPTAGHCMQQISLSFAAIGSTVTPKAVSPTAGGVVRQKSGVLFRLQKTHSGGSLVTGPDFSRAKMSSKRRGLSAPAWDADPGKAPNLNLLQGITDVISGGLP